MRELRTGKEKLGYVISRVLDPIVEIPVLILLATSYALLSDFRWRFFALLLFLDGVLPALYMIYLLRTKRVSDIDFSLRQQRLPMYRFAVSTHLAGVLVAFLIGREPLAQILLSFWLLALIFMWVTRYYKISMHAGVNMTLAVFANLIYGFERMGWLLALPVVVSWARMVYKRHSLLQVVLGMVVPLVLLPFFFWAFGVV